MILIEPTFSALDVKCPCQNNDIFSMIGAGLVAMRRSQSWPSAIRYS